jgi:hypothetical protein
MDRRDHRDREGRQLLAERGDPLEVRQPLLAGHRRPLDQIRARAERIAVARSPHDQRAHIPRRGQLGQGSPELADQHPAKRVSRLRPIHGDLRDIPRAIDLDLAHSTPFSSVVADGPFAASVVADGPFAASSSSTRNPSPSAAGSVRTLVTRAIATR